VHQQLATAVVATVAAASDARAHGTPHLLLLLPLLLLLLLLQMTRL
jgi:hypothetical protein